MGGIHILVDGIGVIPADIVSVLKTAATRAHATVVHTKCVTLPQPSCNPLSPPGGTAVALLDESHITLHWYDLADGTARVALDVFTCGSANTCVAVSYIMTQLNLTLMSYETVKRFAQIPSTQ